MHYPYYNTEFLNTYPQPPPPPPPNFSQLKHKQKRKKEKEGGYDDSKVAHFIFHIFASTRNIEFCFIFQLNFQFKRHNIWQGLISSAISSVEFCNNKKIVKQGAKSCYDTYNYIFFSKTNSLLRDGKPTLFKLIPERFRV